MLIQTSSGSVYEVEPQDPKDIIGPGRARRVHSNGKDKARTPVGVWRDYRILAQTVRGGLWFHWREVDDGHPDGPRWETTITTPVVRVIGGTLA